MARSASIWSLALALSVCGAAITHAAPSAKITSIENGSYQGACPVTIWTQPDLGLSGK